MAKKSYKLANGQKDSIAITSPFEIVIVSPRWGDTAGNMAAANFTKKRNTLTGGSDFFVATPFCDTKSTVLKAKTVTLMKFVSS